MLPGSFVGKVSEFADKFLKDIAHLDVLYFVRVKINLGKTLDDHIQKVRFIQPLNVIIKIEVFQNITGVFGKAIDVISNVGGNIVRVGNQLMKIKLALIVKRQLGLFLEDRFRGFRGKTFRLWKILQYDLFCRLKDAVKKPQNCKRQDYPAVFGLLVIASQQVRDAPNKTCPLFKIIGHPNTPLLKSLIQKNLVKLL